MLICILRKINENSKVAIVTGCSSGIGYETSLLLAKSGFYTYATTRDLSKSKSLAKKSEENNLSLEIRKLDITDETSIHNVIEEIQNNHKRIDVLVNNAGYGLVGSLEDLSINDFFDQFNTNFFGSIRMMKKIIPLMRSRKKGILVNISSITGRIGFPLTSAYTSSKFALEGLCESLFYELENFGIKVILIEPGLVKTNFVNNIKIPQNIFSNPDLSAYNEITTKRIKSFGPRLENGINPFEVAKVIVDAILSSNPKFRYVVGDDAINLIEKKNSASETEFKKFVLDNVINK